MKNVKKLLVLFPVLLGLLVQGCASAHYTTSLKGEPCRTCSDNFNVPLVVMAPNLKSVRLRPIYDNTSGANNEEGFEFSAENNALVTSSYEELASTCHSMDSYAFTLIKRKRGEYPNPITTTLAHMSFVASICTLTILPAWYATDCTIENTMFYQPENSPELQVLKKNGNRAYKRTYHTRSDTFVSIIPFFSRFIPSYRMHKENTYLHDTDLLSAKAFQAHEQDMVQDMIATLFDQTKGTLPLVSYTDAAFNDLIDTIFKKDYDPSKAYFLTVNYQDADVLDAGIYTSVLGTEGKFVKKDGKFIRENILLKEGHLYMRYNFYEGSSSSGNYVIINTERKITDLGHIRDLSPVLLSWLYTTRKELGFWDHFN